MHQAWSRHRGHGSQQSKTLLSSRGYLLKLGDRRMEEGTSGVNYAVCRRTTRVRGSGAGVYPTGSGGSEESSTARPGKGESSVPRHLAPPGATAGVGVQGCSWHPARRGQDAIDYLTMHRRAPDSRELFQPQTPTVRRPGNPGEGGRAAGDGRRGKRWPGCFWN